MSDEGHSSQIISSKTDTELVGYRYTFTQRYKDSDRTWNIEWKGTDPEVKFKEEMGNDTTVNRVFSYGIIL